MVIMKLLCGYIYIRARGNTHSRSLTMPGNTKNWVLTLPLNGDVTKEEWLRRLDTDDLIYYVAGGEVGEGGYHHLQVTLCLNRGCQFDHLKVIMGPTAHIQTRRSE